ncbi:zinc ABC transporter substrate-binding protein [Paracoccus siganidrum]|nr:zinc ABC transporter substrate-binding protein [Paracoccus siganidrum]
MRIFVPATALPLILAAAASAEVPSVAVDIAPVHSLVARVMEGVGDPGLILPPGASPHGHSMRPSEARMLQNADLVVWIGEDLTPWLAGPVATLAGKAESLELLEAEGTTVLEFREGATFEAHGHDEEDHDHEGDGHEDHGHEDDGHDHDHAHDDGDGHDHHGHDPHAWLDPQNARLWLGVIAERLAGLDPENAETYAANAAAGQAELDALSGQIEAALAPVRAAPFVVFHDAYQYFETRFGVTAAGSISLADASDPSPARIAEIQRKVAELGVTCAFAEPQFNPGLIDTVFRGTEARIGTMDPLGSALQPGTQLYPQLLTEMADSLVACLQ